jgi:hypothetical protein
MSEEHQKTFLEELRSLNEPTKRKVLIVATIVIMAIILYLWLGYFNGLVADNQPQQDPGGVSFSQNLKSGMATIANDFANIPQWLAGIFRGPRQYTIQPSK